MLEGASIFFSWVIKKAMQSGISQLLHTNNIEITERYSFRRDIPTESGPGSSVDIATDYGLDGPGSNPGGDEIFGPSRLALRLTQPPVKWVLGLSRG